MHRQNAYSETAPQSVYLTITEKYSLEIVSLPIYPELVDEEVDKVIETTRKAIRNF